MPKMSTAPKEKRRNSEKRKEKSRNAARCRREKETDLFYQLGHMLPLPHNVCSTLDKAGIMRLVLCQLKIDKLLSAESGQDIKLEEEMDTSEKELKIAEKEQMLESLYPKALEGFLLVLSKEGDIVFLSDNVSRYLGLAQIDLLGQSIYEYSHPCDHEELREQLSDRPGLNYISSKPEREHHSFLMRMKCTLTPKGKNVNLKSATYKVVQCTGHIKLSKSEATPFGQLRPPVPCMVLVASPIPHPVNIETPLDTKTFMTRHSMDMKFTDCDERIKDLIGYTPEDLVGRSFYDFHHALDGSQIERCHRNLFAKGQTSTGHYRFLAKEGGYVWLETQATVIYHSKTNKAECVVCVNYVLSGLENNDIPISLDQLVGRDLSGVQRSTEKIFAPKIASSSSEYPLWLMHDKEQESETDFLKFLAPTPGDAMIPLTFPNKELQEDSSEKQKKTAETCKQMNGFNAPLADGENKPLMSANQILFGQPGSVVDIPAKDLDMIDKNCPLSSSHDPLLATDCPGQQGTTSKQSFDDLLSDEDLLSLYAPYIPMGEDLDLSADLENNPAGIETNSSWQPVDPFSHNLEEEGFTNYIPVTQENTLPFAPSEFSSQPRSPPSLLSSPSAPSHPNSPGSSFGGSMPNLCMFPGLPFSPVTSPRNSDGVDYPTSSQGQMVTPAGRQEIESVTCTTGNNMVLQPAPTVYQTAGNSTTIVGGVTGMIGGRPPQYTMGMGQYPTTMPTPSLKRKLNIPLLDTGQQGASNHSYGNVLMKLGTTHLGEPPEKIRMRNNQQLAAKRTLLAVTSGADFSHSNLLQQVARNHADPYNISRSSGGPYFGRLSTSTSGISSKPSGAMYMRSPTPLRNIKTNQSLHQMDELCRIFSLNT
uniref:Hypoxia-inducible factor-1a m n=1 Tax=Stichopus japonicus TaxID=307972 RepID=A0A8E4PK12_STIJA|nr:Hypoxia-inducible factor-1a m [Apostichopus japonicus]